MKDYKETQDALASLLEAGFSLNESFLAYILCQIFVGMVFIFLHVDFNCIFISDILWVM